MSLLSRRPAAWAAGTVGLLAVLLYLPALFFPFHFDDRLFLHDDNIRLGRWENIVWPLSARPLTWLTFMAQYRLHGADAGWFRLLNVLAHAANTVLLFFLIQCVLSVRPAQGRPTRALAAAFLGAAIFACHPLQTESVLYVYQRSTLLAATAGLASLLCYVQGRHMPALLLMLLATGFKETAAILPLGFYVFDVWVRGRLRPSRPVIASAACAAAAAAVALFRRPDILAGSLADSLVYASTQVPLYWQYIGLSILPARQNLDWDIQAQAPAAAPGWIAALLALAALAGLALYTRRRFPLAGFWTAFFLIFLIPSSSFIPAADYFFEHRVYLSLAGWCGLVSLLTYRLLNWHTQHDRKAMPAFGTVLFLLLLWLSPSGYAAAAASRMETWRTEEALWRDAAAKSPRKYRPHYNLGILLMRSSPAEAILHLSRAVEIDPFEPRAYRGLGQVYFELGLREESTSHWRQSLALDSGDWESHLALGQLLLLDQNYGEAIRHFQAAQTISPSDWRGYYYLAQAYLRLGLAPEAVAECEAGLQLDWRNTRLRFLLADAVLQTGAFSRAIELYREGLESAPDAWAYFNLAQAYRAQGDPEAALGAVQQGLAAAASDDQLQHGYRLYEAFRLSAGGRPSSGPAGQLQHP